MALRMRDLDIVWQHPRSGLVETRARALTRREELAVRTGRAVQASKRRLEQSEMLLRSGVRAWRESAQLTPISPPSTRTP